MKQPDRLPPTQLTEKQKTFLAEIAAPLEPPEPLEHTRAHANRSGGCASSHECGGEKR